MPFPSRERSSDRRLKVKNAMGMSPQYWHGRSRGIPRFDGALLVFLRHALLTAAVALMVSAANTFAASFVVTATDVAPSMILDGQRREMLRLAVVNPVPTGPVTALLSSFGVRLERASGAGLGTIEAGNLLAAIEVYLDANASGAFEAGADTFVAALYSPDLAVDGSLSIDLTASEPATVQVSSGNTRNYFIVGRMNPEASTASPNALRLTHLGSGAGASSAVDAGGGGALTLTGTANVTSKLITATLNQPPTTTGIAEVVAFDNATQDIIPLYPAFNDAEDASNALTYTLTGNTNPSLFAFVGIEEASGRLLITYLPGVTGMAQLTVKAKDTLGKAVSTTFQVKVIPFVTYSDFQAVHPNAGGPLESSLGNGQLNLLSYAFFLNQGTNGGTLGLPRLQGIGNACIFSHLRPRQASDVFYNYQVSQDLQSWVPAVKNIDYYENTKDLGDGSVRVELLLLNGWQKAFMRVQTQLIGALAPPPPPANGATEPTPNNPPAVLPPPPSPGVPILSSAVYPDQTVLSTDYVRISGMVVKDLNNDGFKDIAVASQSDDKVSWFLNNQNGTFGAEQVVTTDADGANAVAAGDLDNDGLVDLACAALNQGGKVMWYKRNANGTYGAPQILATLAQFPTAVEIADLDNDGKKDVIFVALFGDAISWCKNNGNGSFNPKQVLASQTVAPWTVHVADLDGDGVLDLATASINRHSVEWYKGNGNGTFGTKRLLTPLDDQQAEAPVSLSSGDLDGDGYVDLVCCFTNSRKIVWFKNNQNIGFAARQDIASQSLDQVFDVTSVMVSDLNGDGKPDVLASCLSDNRIAWYRNLGGGNFGNPVSNQSVISDSAVGAWSVGVGDFDMDGKLDVASISQDDSKVAIYLNRGGQSAFFSNDTAPAVFLDGQKRAMLRIELWNRGVSGNDNARLDTLSLLLESGPGIPLTTDQANALIDNLMIYADSNDSGAFEPETDLTVAIVPYLSLNAGRVTVSVRGNALPVQIAPGTCRSFFVVPQLTANAAGQAPNTFRMTHLISGPAPSSARDAFSGALLTMEASPNLPVASSLSTAQINNSPTTIGLPDINVSNTISVSSILVRSYFNDVEDGAAGLRYEITENTNAGLFSFVGIDATGKLVIRYRPGISGNASLTMKATDSLGKWVSSTFGVSVSLANTFGNWSGGSGVAGQTGLLRYAFGLTPLGGDVAGLPRMKIQGKARVVTHQKPMWATDLNYQYEISQDLVNWIPAIPGVHYHEFTKDLPNALRQSECVLLVNWPKAYLRVRANLTN